MVQAKISSAVDEGRHYASKKQAKRLNDDEHEAVRIRGRNFLRRLHRDAELIYIFVKMPQECGGPYLGFYELKKLNKLYQDLQPFCDKAVGIYYSLNTPQNVSDSTKKNCLLRATGDDSLHKGNIARRTAFLIDIDSKRSSDTSANKVEKKSAEVLMQKIRDDLRQAGWPTPAVIDSGNGYHLIFRVDLDGETELVKRCLQALASRYNTQQAHVDTTVHDAPRVARLPGTHARKGISDPDRPHRQCNVLDMPKEFVAVPESLLVALANQFAASPNKLNESTEPKVTKPSKQEATETVNAARKYLAKLPPAISGEKGRNRFFHAACVLVEKFELDRKEALPLLQEYNQGCVPPFNDQDVAKKLDSAIEKINGKKTQSSSPSAISVPRPDPALSKKPSFIGWIPDYGIAQSSYVFQTANNVEVQHDFLLGYWLQTSLLNSHVLVPDILLRQIYMGANYDKNWKKRLPQKTKLSKANVPLQCLAQKCPLYGSGVKHQHFFFRTKENGILDSFCPPEIRQFNKSWRFYLYAPEYSKLFQKYRTDGTLTNIYWPALVLGASPKVGWKWLHQRLLVGIAHELTRDTKDGKFEIVGEEIRGNQVVVGKDSSQKMICPYLNPKEKYVVFGGNKRRKGLGYMLIGRNFKGWLFKAGFLELATQPADKRRESIRTFLVALSELTDQLGLIPAAIAWGKWRNIYEMLDCTKTGNGMDWLEKCTMRIFAPHDWRTQWRKFFSEKLGFSWIPSSPDDLYRNSEQQDFISPEVITSSVHVERFLQNNKWTQKQLAQRIREFTGQPCSVKRVQRHLAGICKSKEFFAQVESIRQQHVSSATPQS